MTPEMQLWIVELMLRDGHVPQLWINAVKFYSCPYCRASAGYPCKVNAVDIHGNRVGRAFGTMYPFAGSATGWDS